MRSSGPERFDLAIAATTAVLMAAIGVVVARGDQIGIAIQSFGPQDSASGRSPIRLVFDEPVAPAAIDAHFAIEPPVQGKFVVSLNQVTFLPNLPMAQGQQYTVTVKAGIQSSGGRLLKHDLQWRFRVRAPRVAYLGPVDSIIENLYLVDPASPDSPQELTQAKQGVLGYEPAPDGSGIVYMPLESNGTSSLYFWDAATGTSRLMYECKDAACSGAAWRPDGGAIAFERVELNSGTGLSAGAPRVWVLDLSTNSARPLFSDNQRVGYMPRWSPDGTRLAVVNGADGAIVIHDYTTGQDKTIPALQGEFGPFSPDGNWLYFPKVLMVNDAGFVTHLVLVDLSSNLYVQHDLVPDNDPSDDLEAAWLPDSKHLIVARRAEGSAGVDNPQLFSVDVASRAATPLVVDPTYSNSNLSVDPTGNTILFQRFPLDKPGARPEIWIYRLATKQLERVSPNGASPRWMP